MEHGKYGEHGPLKIDELPMKSYEHRIHGAAIYGNMDPMNIPQMLAYITWILWDTVIYGIILPIDIFQMVSSNISSDNSR